MEFIHHYEREYNIAGGNFKITGLELHRSLSEHPLATQVLRKRKNEK